MSSLFSLSAEVLGQIALMQSVVAQLPDKESMLSFACQGLSDVTGVAEAVFRYDNIHSSQPQVGIASNKGERIFPICRNNFCHAYIVLHLSDTTAFLPYTPYIENFCNMLAVVFEELRQHEEKRCLLADLEHRVAHRTAELEIEIRERQKAEEQLSYSNSLTKAALEATADGILVVKRDGKIVRWNEKFVDLFQIPEELLNTEVDYLVLQHITSLMAQPDDFLFKVKELYENPENSSVDLLHLADGRIFERYSQPVTIKDEIVARFWSFRDITERKRNEQLIIAERDRAQNYLDMVEAIIVALDEQGRIKLINRKGCQILGRTEKELIGASWFQTCLPQREDMDKIFTYYRKLIQGEIQSKEYFENTILSADGNLHEIAWRNSLLRDEKGTIIGTLSAGEDITERKQSEAALRDSRTKLEAAMASMTDAVFISDNTDIFDFNDAFASFHRFENKAACFNNRSRYTDLLEFFTMEGKPVAHERWPIFRALRGEIVTYAEYTLRRKDTGESWVGSYSFSPIKDHRNMIVGSVVVARDITELKRNEEARVNLETQLKQVQKMEAIGHLAGGVAHDFNNMLSVILGHAEMAMEQIDTDHPVFEDLGEISKAAQRSADITRQLLAFARKQTIIPKVIDLNTVVEGMLKMLRRLIGEDVSLAWMPAFDLWQVNIDPSQVDQILVNLCVNARDAISGVGSITVETKNSIINEEYCRNNADAIAGDYVILEVSDTGCGMHKETMSHIFEPFFTTKGIGEGTGLGLSTVYGVVKQNNGFITVYSDPGRGTRFKIYLPRHLSKTVPIKIENETPGFKGGNGTILLVEDEPMILNMASEMLRSLGYSVIGVSTPGEAIRLVGDLNRTIHLLITDMIMPEMNGKELAEKLLAQKPGMKCLFMSGYAADIITKQGVLVEDMCFLQKPFSKKEFAAKVQTALDQDPA